MDMARVGGIIAGRRKAKGLTQMQLAERVGVTNKAVSKWERGLNYPDIALLELLAASLELTVPELLRNISLYIVEKRYNIWNGTF